LNEKIVFDPTKEREAKTPLDSTAIKEKIANGDLKIKGKNKPEKKHKTWLSKKTHKALEEKAKAEGKTPDEKAVEIIVEKAKPKPETSPFPADARINDYGFLGFKTGWLADLGWTKGMALKVDKNTDGSLTLRKA